METTSEPVGQKKVWFSLGKYEKILDRRPLEFYNTIVIYTLGFCPVREILYSIRGNIALCFCKANTLHMVRN